MSEASTTPYSGFDNVFIAGEWRAGRSDETLVWAAMLPQERSGFIERAGLDLPLSATYKTIAPGGRPS